MLAQAAALERELQHKRDVQEDETMREVGTQEALENAERIEPVDAVRRRVDLRLVQRPALQAARSFTVLFGPDRGDLGPVVRWAAATRSRRPIRAVTDARGAVRYRPGDAIQVLDAPLPLPAYRRLFEEGAGIQIPVLEPGWRAGCDGEFLDLERWIGGTRVYLSWWSGGPPRWSELDRWARKALRLFEICGQAAR